MCKTHFYSFPRISVAPGMTRRTYGLRNRRSVQLSYGPSIKSITYAGTTPGHPAGAISGHTYAPLGPPKIIACPEGTQTKGPRAESSSVYRRIGVAQFNNSATFVPGMLLGILPSISSSSISTALPRSITVLMRIFMT
jgi:hypothetical protein